MKHSSTKSPFTVREKPVIPGDKGVLCPFCDPPHPLVPGGGNRCGTTVRITAVQIVIPQRTVRQRKLICLKCGKGDGEMVMLQNSQYVHLVDCMPGTHIVVEPPNFSPWAKYVLKLPETVRNQVEKYTGKASVLKEIDAQGQDTGNIVGYFFWKDGSNGASRTTPA